MFAATVPGFAAAPSVSEVAGLSDEMDRVLAEAQNAEATQVFDQNFLRVRQDAFLMVAQNLVVSETALLAAIDSLCEHYAQNPALRAALTAMRRQIEVTGNLYEQTYGQVPLTTVDAEADRVALEMIKRNIAGDLTGVREELDAYNAQLALKKEEVAKFLRSNKQMLWEAGSRLPSAPEESMAFVYEYGDPGCYFINSGRWGGAYEGRACGVVDGNGDFIATIEIVACTDTVSAGVLLHSINVPMGARIPDLVFRSKPLVEEG